MDDLFAKRHKLQEENMDITKIKQEQLIFLRNNDIFTISERGVTTAAATGTLSGETTITIARTNVKNIRSITVDSVAKSLGSDYEVNYGDSTTNCVITFVAEQTGVYSVSHDYGSDKVYPDFPRDDLTIGSYPRIAIDLINIPTQPLGIGGDTFISDVNFTIVVYANKTNTIDSYIQAIRELYISNSKNFYYLGIVMPTSIGPMIKSTERNDEIMQRNADFVGRFEVDSA